MKSLECNHQSVRCSLGGFTTQNPCSLERIDYHWLAGWIVSILAFALSKTHSNFVRNRIISCNIREEVELGHATEGETIKRWHPAVLKTAWDTDLKSFRGKFFHSPVMWTSCVFVSISRHIMASEDQHNSTGKDPKTFARGMFNIQADHRTCISKPFVLYLVSFGEHGKLKSFYKWLIILSKVIMLATNTTITYTIAGIMLQSSESQLLKSPTSSSIQNAGTLVAGINLSATIKHTVFA